VKVAVGVGVNGSLVLVGETTGVEVLVGIEAATLVRSACTVWATLVITISPVKVGLRVPQADKASMKSIPARKNFFRFFRIFISSLRPSTMELNE
jgi:hypothetical protein